MVWLHLLKIIVILSSIVLNLNVGSAIENKFYNYTFTKTWDGYTPSDPVQIFVSYSLALDPEGLPSLRILVDAPYYNDPKIPEGSPLTLRGLWDLEVVEPYFLGENSEYLEIELAPSGHFILFYLSGYRKDTNKTESLLLKHYSAIKYEDQGRWRGEAFIPGRYFPCKIQKFNLFAIHKSGKERRYMALYPVKEGEIPKPDFHHLSAFQKTPFEEGVEINPNCGWGGIKKRKNMANSASFKYSKWSHLSILFVILSLFH